MSSSFEGVPTPPPLPPKPRKHTIKIQRNMGTVNNNNYTTFDFKEKDRFSGKDFKIWSVRVKAILEEKELWGHVTSQMARPTPVDPNHVTAAETRDMLAWDKDERKTHTILMQALTTETMHHMLSTVTTKEAWNQLQDSYAAKDTLALVMATQSFY